MIYIFTTMADTYASFTNIINKLYNLKFGLVKRAIFRSTQCAQLLLFPITSGQTMKSVRNPVKVFFISKFQNQVSDMKVTCKWERQTGSS